MILFGIMKTNNPMYLTYWLLLILFFYHTPQLQSQQIDYFSPQNLKRFANDLYQHQDYGRAVGEYQRLLAFTSKAQDSIIYRIANCHEKQGELNKANQYYKKIFLHPDSRLMDYSYYQVAVNLFYQEQYQKAILYLDSHRNRIKEQPVRKECDYLKGINLVYLDQWNKARSLLEKYNDQKFTRTAMYVAEKSELSFKKPWLAGTLSTILPGSGKFYTDHKGDAFYTVMVLALTGYLTYDGIQDEKTAKSWIFGTMFTGFYLGNIYGSIISAKVYNEKKLKTYVQDGNFQLRIYNEIPF